jgi:riboflavin kinase/FMN adenylyltransferase
LRCENPYTYNPLESFPASPPDPMKIVRGLTNACPSDRGCVLTIGNFDGMHLGHEAIVGHLAARGREHGLPTAMLTFEPNPREYFDPANAPARLMRLRDKAARLAELGLDRLILLKFDERLRAWDGNEFIERVLVEALGVRHVVIGNAFRFGKGRSGTVDLLREAGRRHGYEVDEVQAVQVDGERVSSTRIRAALARGDMATVRKLLGRDYRMTGRVMEGRRLGRTLGYATANLRLHRRVSPVAGVFAVRVHGIDGGTRPGVASVGTRPTVGSGEVLLEAHVFDWQGDLYGRYLGVDFVAKLRDESKFPDIDTLVERMHVDARQARELLADG